MNIWIYVDIIYKHIAKISKYEKINYITCHVKRFNNETPHIHMYLYINNIQNIILI